MSTTSKKGKRTVLEKDAPLKTTEKHERELRLRANIELPKCEVFDCWELPSDLLPPNMQVQRMLFCQPHAEKLASLISKRNYDDLQVWLKNRNIRGKPHLDSFAPAEKRRCGIPRCRKNGDKCAITFEPYRVSYVQNGWDWKRYVWLCESHEDAAQFIAGRLNGLRVIGELSQKTRPQDPERTKRSRAIRQACAKHQGTTNYIRAVCQDLQKQNVRMPSRWTSDWNKRGFRVEQTHWLDAYQSNIAKLRIQKHISKVGNLRIRNSR